ncbi:hypothetical protein [Ruminococcus sp. XPD3002]|uniref:hypothetical protein n=1 Tax=Ruminococcus sp. XPD3002 TaxID=1452269 RepID=UPI0009225B8F|nr:hypothetical protein SAMN04487832_105159 [Ruminococcus flavefaciens]
MNENKQEIKLLKQSIQKLRSMLKKTNDSIAKKREKIHILQAELNEEENELNKMQDELSEQEEKLKRYEYSSALTKLDDAALKKLSRRQAELLAEHILSGTIESLLEEENKKDTAEDFHE